MRLVFDLATKAKKSATYLWKFSSIIKHSIYLVSITQVIGRYGGCVVRCQGDSMEPTVQNGDFLWAKRWNPHCEKQKLLKGDIICLIHPQDPRSFLLKRIGSIKSIHREGIEVLGDNAARSIDSREYGLVPPGLVQYKATCRIWPLRTNNNL